MTLTAPGGIRVPGTIHNFSAGGLLVEAHVPLIELPDHIDVTIREDIPVVSARIVRIADPWVAIAFDHVQLGVAARLRPRSAEGYPAAPPRREAKQVDPKLARELQAACSSYFVGQTSAFLDHAKERLIDAADSAGSNARQAMYFEAFTVLRRKQKAIEEGLEARLDGRGMALESAREGPAAPDGEDSELSLVDETEFDIWLIESDVASNAESALTDQLEALNSRLSGLLGEAVDERNNPFAPRAIIGHCSDVLIGLELDALARKFALRSFGEAVMRESTPLYDRLNQILENAGLSYRRKKPSFRPRRGSRQGIPIQEQPADAAAPTEGQTFAPPEGAVPAGAASAGAAPAGDDSASMPPGSGGWSWADPSTPSGTLLDLHHLLSRPRAASSDQLAPGDAAAVESPQISPEMLAEVLEDLQVRAHRTRHQRLQDRLDAALDDLAGGVEPHPDLSPAQQDAVYLTDELLASMTGDLLASEQGKTWIGELEVPLLRLLLQNEDILTDPEHPARQLLDHLGQAHWRAESDTPRDQAMVSEVDRIIDDLVDGGRLDRQGLQHAADAVSRLVKRARRRADANMRRVLEACRGQERLNSARGAVEKKLRTRFGGREVSKILSDLLDSGYRDLLAVEALRTPEGEARDDDTFAVVERLDERLTEDEETPGDIDPETDRQLVELVRERLEMTGADPGTQRELVESLEAQLRGDAATEKQEIEFPEEKPPPEDDAEEASLDERLWLGQAKLLDVGDWMIFPDDRGHGRPLKLAWVSSGRDRYVFVDREGHKALELHEQELASRIGSGDATLGETGDRPLTDRSWQQIVEGLQNQLAHQATHDDTSGLLNRKEFERRVRLRISESKLADTAHAVILTDLDQFRLINSTSGHDAGDQMLHEVGQLIRDFVPDTAEVARTGSDEFAVLVPRCGDEDIGLLAEALRETIKNHSIDWNGKRISTTTSVGWVIIDRESTNFSTIFSQLEIACSTAREAGDSVCAFQPTDDNLARKDRALLRVRQLDDALGGNGLVLVAQRIQQLQGEETGEHYEVLARLRTPDGEMVRPEEFVTAAETYGRVHLLDRAVLDTTLRALAMAPLGDRIDCLSVNISGLTFARTGFVAHVTSALGRLGLDPSRLCLEITESAAMSDLARCADVVRELRDLGCRFSLDDFGTGLSSFSYLKNLPVDYLKIDGSFIRRIHEDEDDRGLVRSMHEMAHLLGKETIAEFAESVEIIDELKQIGIDYAQGYGIDEPQPLHDILGLPAALAG